MQKSRDPYRFLLDYAFFLLGRRSYSRAELIKKCKLRAEKIGLEGSEQAIKKVVARLQELDYINDEKFATVSLQASLALKPHGKRLFITRMHRKGISAQTTEDVWAAHGIDESALARKLIAIKTRQLSKLDPVKRKQRIAYLLASRGFKSDFIWEAIRD